jgi:aspartate-semialdehyde dehydrogenase
MKVGIIGWRGMVGSVLMQRMRECGDFEGLETSFFSTSAAGKPGPEILGEQKPLLDAFDLEALAAQEVLITCQGGGHTNDVYPRLRASGWDGYFIDAARALRMNPETVLILDPVNRPVIDQGLADGKKTYAGPNCTVSLALLAIDGLLKEGLVEWVSAMTYQAASGGGAQHMRELIDQMGVLASESEGLRDPAGSILELDRQITASLRGDSLPKEHFGVALAGSLIPWIDEPVEGGQTREEWKAFSEGNKILGRSERPIPFDGLCVRVGTMRCHSQGLTIKLTRDVPLDELTQIIAGANDWVRVVDNERGATLDGLSPAAVSGTLDVAVGRLRKMHMGPQYLSAFTVGDQLLWGAAEPLRRMLAILRKQL